VTLAATGMLEGALLDAAFRLVSRSIAGIEARLNARKPEEGRVAELKRQFPRASEQSVLEAAARAGRTAIEMAGAAREQRQDKPGPIFDVHVLEKRCPGFSAESYSWANYDRLAKAELLDRCRHHFDRMIVVARVVGIREPLSQFDWDLLLQQACRPPDPESERNFLVGLSVGQGLQPTGVAVLERLMPSGQSQSRSYVCRYLCRYRPPDTTYPILISKLKEMLRDAPLKDSDLIVEAGPGIRAAQRLLQKHRLQARIHAVEIKASADDGYVDGLWRVTKASVIETTRQVLQENRLAFDDRMSPKIMATTPSAQTLYQALATYPYIKSPLANEAFAAREGADDDLILAVALACWFGECCKREFWVR
jgi:hypothetical protein